jgi:hypothetical protein
MSISNSVYTTPFVAKDPQGVAYSAGKYSYQGSPCLNGPQWSYDQYGRGPVSFNSLPDTCAGSQAFLIHRMNVEGLSRPEYFAKLNAAGIVGYENISSDWDSQFGQQVQNRSAYLGIIDPVINPEQGVQNRIEAENATPYQILGTNTAVESGPSF